MTLGPSRPAVFILSFCRQVTQVVLEPVITLPQRSEQLSKRPAPMPALERTLGDSCP